LAASALRTENEEAALFAEQIAAVVGQQLSDEGGVLFDHFTQTQGLLILAVGISKLHGLDRAGFKRMVDDIWKICEHVEVTEVEAP